MTIIDVGPGGAVALGFDNDVKLSFGTGNRSQIYNDGTDNFWDLVTVGSGGLMIAGAASFPSPDAGMGSAVHLWHGSAGTVSANNQTTLILESSSTVALTLLSPNNQARAIYFGEPAQAIRGSIIYFGSTDSPADTMRLSTAGSARVHISAGAFAFQEETEMSSTAGRIILSPSTYVDLTKQLKLLITDTDGTVEAQIWYDASEDKLKFKTAAGVETITSA
jgi:hypothetical protein